MKQTILTSQVIATTEDDTRIILEDDHTWRLAKDMEYNNDVLNALEEPIVKKMHPNNLSVSPKEAANTIGFRGLSWGDSVEQLKSLNPNITWDINTVDGYKLYEAKDTIGGKRAEVLYMFTENYLVAGMYCFLEEHTSENAYYQDYEYISQVLNAKYPMTRSEAWNTNTYKTNPDRIGCAIQSGHVTFSEQYKDNSTTIIHAISGGNNCEIEHILIYKSRVMDVLSEVIFKNDF